MKTVRVHIKGWTASYRYPHFVLVQPTVPIPPLSTVYGIISAAAGKLITPKDTAIGFVAPYKAKDTDLERIYQIGESGKIEKTNVIKREFLYEPELYIYLTNTDFKDVFDAPRYPILLGRSCDLAQIKEVKLVDLEPKDEAILQYTLLPFPFENVPNPIMALPVYFNDATPREPMLVKGFHIIEKPLDHAVKGDHIFLDKEKNWGVFIHDYLREI